MSQKALEIAIERELENVFGYDRFLHDNFLVELKINHEPSIVDLIDHIREIERKPSLIRTRPFLLIVFTFIAVLCPLYFIPETKTTVIIIGVFELIIIVGIIGFGLIKLYEKLIKIKAKKEIKKVIIELQVLAETLKNEKTEGKEEAEKQKLLETLRALDIETYKESVGKSLIEVKQIIKNYSIKEANNLLEKEDVRKHICPALKSVTDDVFDISKSITPILVDCVTAGTISIPLNPVLFAAIAVVIARMGISALCAGFITK